jgi:hypothetical protein
MAICADCDKVYDENSAKEEYDDFLYSELGYQGDVLEAAQSYFEYDFCGECNIRWFKAMKDEFEDNYGEPLDY